MVGANYMGGKGKSAKARTHNKSRRKTKEHFAKGHMATHYLYPSVSQRGNLVSTCIKPTFEFGHARRDLGQVTPRKGGGSTNRINASTRTKTVNSRSIQEHTLSKAMRSLETEEPISYSWMKKKAIESIDIGGLPTRRRFEKPAVALSASHFKDEARPPKDPTLSFPLDDLPSSVSSPASSYVPVRSSRTPIRLAALAHHPGNLSNYNGHSHTLTHQEASFSPWAPTSQPNCKASVHDLSLPQLSASRLEVDGSPSPANSACIERESGPIQTINLAASWEILAEWMGIELPPGNPFASVLPIDFMGHPGLPSHDRSGADFRWALCSPTFPASLYAASRDHISEGQLSENDIKYNTDREPVLEARSRTVDPNDDRMFGNQDEDPEFRQATSLFIPSPSTLPSNESQTFYRRKYDHSYLSESPSPSSVSPKLPQASSTSVDCNGYLHSAASVSPHCIQELFKGGITQDLSDDTALADGDDYSFEFQLAHNASLGGEPVDKETSLEDTLEGRVDGKRAILEVDGRLVKARRPESSEWLSELWHAQASEGTTAHAGLELGFDKTPHSVRDEVSKTPVSTLTSEAEGVTRRRIIETSETNLVRPGLSNANGRLLGPSLFDDCGSDED
ncbi:hypothetical protein FRB95_004488 [Tulasnella sp. JGI-2019a]|nr:hypothetical protein FRB95_004488 [Tulasnella sp. JGI-2019a]